MLSLYFIAVPQFSTPRGRPRSEEHTSELQSQSISYAVFCLKKKKPEVRARSPLPTSSSFPEPDLPTLPSFDTRRQVPPTPFSSTQASVGRSKRLTLSRVVCGH